MSAPWMKRGRLLTQGLLLFCFVLSPRSRLEAKQSEEVSTQDIETSFTLRHELTLGYSWAPLRSAEAQRELPWRPLEKSALTPIRLGVGLGYTLDDTGWSAELSGRLYRSPQYVGGSLATVYEPADLSPLMLGELSLRYRPQNQIFPMITFGRFLPHLGGELSHLGGEAPLEMTALEARHWSRSISPHDRWVHGLGLNRSFKGVVSDTIDLHYLFAFFSPADAELLAHPLNRGVVLLGSFQLSDDRWRAAFSGAKAWGLPLQEEDKKWADERLIGYQARTLTAPLSSRALERDAQWLRVNLEAQWAELATYRFWVSSAWEERWAEVSSLRSMEEAAFSELNGMGSGRTWTARIYGERRSSSSSFAPQLWSLSYTGRDPHQQFQYDDRHWISLSLTYPIPNLPPRFPISVILNGYHLWSAVANRAEFNSDMLSLIISSRH